MTWADLIPQPKPQRNPARGDAFTWGCGHEKTPENSIGVKQKRCRICKRIASEELRKTNPDYYREWRRKNPTYMADYARRKRIAVKVHLLK